MDSLISWRALCKINVNFSKGKSSFRSPMSKSFGGLLLEDSWVPSPREFFHRRNVHCKYLLRTTRQHEIVRRTVLVKLMLIYRSDSEDIPEKENINVNMNEDAAGHWYDIFSNWKLSHCLLQTLAYTCEENSDPCERSFQPVDKSLG